MNKMPIPHWDTCNIPDQSGRVILITGGNSGIGYETARALAGAGAQVIIAGRNPQKCRQAIALIKAEYPDAVLAFEPLDLANLCSVADSARRIRDSYAHLDVLINNAGIMAPVKRETTADGFELQFGVNFLSHFALTALLLPSLRRAHAPRVITLSSVVHKAGKLDFDDLQWQRRRYAPNRVYHDSKLATLMFAQELQRRSDQAQWGLHSIASHPGIARTELMANGPGLNNLGGWFFSAVIKPFFSHSAANGALPTLFAATASEARDGGYYGPSRRFELIGPPTTAKIAPRARDTQTSSQLWEAALRLTRCEFA